MTRERKSHGFVWMAMIVVLTCFSFEAAHAGESSADLGMNSVTARLPEAKTDKKHYETTGEVFIDTSRTLSDEDHPSFSGFYRFDATVHDNQRQLSLSFDAAYAREYTYQRDDGTDGDWVFGMITAAKAWQNGKDFSLDAIDHFVLAVVGGLPVGLEAQRRTFQGSIGPSVSVDKKLGRFLLNEGLTYSRGFYEYDIRSDGTVNSPDVFLSRSALGLGITDKITLQLLYLYTYAVSYQSVGKAADTTYIEMDYQPMKATTFAIGVATDRASTLDPDGQANRLRFYDPESAAVYFDVTLDF